MDQAINTESQTSRDQDKKKVASQDNQHASAMATRLRDFTTINFVLFFGTDVDEYPQEFLDEVYKILFAMGLSTIEKLELAAINSMTWLRHGTIN